MNTGSFDDFERVDAILRQALELAPDDRERFVTRACGTDEGLLERVRAMLADAEGPTGGITPGGAMRGPVWDGIGRDAGAGEIAAGARFGPWQVGEEIGRGGMAVVYRGQRADGAFEQQVAIKLLLTSRAGAFEKRFLRERRILARLEHPNIARLLDAGTTESGRSYLVMEFVQGEPIDRYCSRRQPPIGERLRLFLKVCAAVQFAHRNLVVHRDLKPSNILVTADGEPKLLDFGIAKLLEADPETGDLTRTALVDRVLTPQYASPEQVLGEPVSTATDVYALGLLLYELLTGQRTRRFDSSSPREIERIICDTEPVAPSLAVSPPRLARRLKGDLDNIVLKALRREPGRRYTSAEQLAADVRNHLQGRPVEARPDSVVYRLSKFISRHAVGVATSAGVILLTAGLIAFYTERLARERDAARQAATRAQVETAKAEQVVEFLMGLFEVSRPEQARGEEITARDLLALGVERADALHDQPEVRARLLAVTGKTYHRLGVYDEAEVLYRQALALRLQHFGPAHAQVAESFNDLGVLLKDQGNREDARFHLDHALDLRRRLLGEEHEDIAVTLNSLARLSGHQGDYERQVSLHRQALAMRRKLLGEDHREVGTSLNDLGLALWNQGDTAGARPLLEQALLVYRNALGDEHPWVASAMSNLALIHMDERNWSVAESMLRESISMDRRFLSEEHPVRATHLNNLAFVLREQGQLEEAESLLREAIGISRSALGDKHPMVAHYLVNLARVHLDGHEPASAESLLEEALEIRLTTYSEDHWTVAETRVWLGASLAAQGRFENAEPLLLAGYAGVEAGRGRDDRRTREAADQLVRLYEASGRPEEAEKYRYETGAE